MSYFLTIISITCITSLKYTQGVDFITNKMDTFVLWASQALFPRTTTAKNPQVSLVSIKYNFTLNFSELIN